MKINYLVNARIPTEKAHGYQICKMCEELARAKNDVRLYLPKRENPIHDDLFTYYDLEKNFDIKKINSYDFFKHVNVLGGRLSYYLQSLFYFFAVLFHSFGKEGIIYTRNPSLVWLGYLKGVRVVYECHDWFASKIKIYLFFLRHVDYLITTNKYIKEEFIKHGFRKDKILVAPNGINLQIFDLPYNKEEAVKILPLSENKKNIFINHFVLLYTGSFRTMGETKGMDEILEAIKNLDDKKIFFVAVGGTEKDIEFYQKKANKLEIANQTLFLPRFSQKELAIFQKSADIMLMPFPDKAHYRYHMTPLKMFEYMAGRRPIIASDLPSIREVLNDNNAVFVKPGDSQDLANKIKKIIVGNIDTAVLSKQALFDVKKYTWQKRTEEILNFIKYGK